MTQDELKSRLHYNPETGIFTWLDNPSASTAWRNRYPGRRAGTSHKLGYIVISINKQRHLAHRLAFLYVFGRIPISIDHVDGDPSNNKIENLRETTQAGNMRNICINCRNTSGMMGVAWDSSRAKWCAWINVNGRQVDRKRFTSKADAIRHRQRLESKYGFHANHGKRPKKSPS